MAWVGGEWKVEPKFRALLVGGNKQCRRLAVGPLAVGPLAAQPALSYIIDGRFRYAVEIYFFVSS